MKILIAAAGVVLVAVCPALLWAMGALLVLALMKRVV